MSIVQPIDTNQAGLILAYSLLNCQYFFIYFGEPSVVPFAIMKVVHLVSIFLFLTATTVTFFRAENSVSFKILSGLATFLIFFSGLGLVGALHAGFPTWVALKSLLWIAITAWGALAPKLLRRYPWPAYVVLLVLGSTAACLVVFKPLS